jgi:putative ABC transport system substrate-binding protein
MNSMGTSMNTRATTGLAIVLALALGGAADAETKRIYGIFYEGCEHVCEGFKAALAESGFDAELVVRDIAMDKSVLPQAIAEARALSADLVLTYGTSVTLGTIGKLTDTTDPRYISDIPTVFTMVADPFGSGIAKSFESTGRPNVAGTFNRVPEAVNIEVIRQYDPTFKKLGLLYNSDEANSVVTYFNNDLLNLC